MKSLIAIIFWTPVATIMYACWFLTLRIEISRSTGIAFVCLFYALGIIYLLILDLTMSAKRTPKQPLKSIIPERSILCDTCEWDGLFTCPEPDEKHSCHKEKSD